MKRILALSFFSVLLIMACKKEYGDPQLPSEPAPEVPVDQRFELNLDLTNGYENQFVIVSDREGTIVFDTMLTRFSGLKKINAFATEELHITHGKQSGNNFFSIDTYANIRSGFTYKDNQGSCDNDLFNSSSLTHQLNLIIANTPLVDSVYLPFRTPFDSPPQIDVDNNQVIIEGSILKDQNYLITLQVNSSTPLFKSYLLQFDDLLIDSLSGPQEVTLEVDFSLFEDALVHEIDLGGINGDWIINVSGTQGNGETVQLFRTFTFLEFQEGDMIRMFRLPNLEIEQYLVSISNSKVYDRFVYRKIENTLPGEISFYDPEVTFNDKTKKSFNVSISDIPSLTRVRYEYSVNGWVNYWTTYVYNENEIDIVLPQIRQGIIQENWLIFNAISDPRKLVVESFQIEDFYGQDFYGINIDKVIKCNNYISRIVADEF